jgi:hypothetical protein
MSKDAIIPPKGGNRVRLIGSGPHVKPSTDKFIRQAAEDSGRSIGEVIDLLVEHIQGSDAKEASNGDS